MSTTQVEWAKQKADDDHLNIEFVCQSVADRTLINLDGYVFIGSAITSNEDEKAPKISPIKRCFVNRESIVEELRRRGFGLLEEWRNNGTHEH